MSNQTHIEESPRKGKAKTASTEPKFVVVNYDGMASAAKGQPGVEHTLSPLIAFWPETGVLDLILHPGVNLVDAKLWSFYTAECNGGKGAPQLMAKIEGGEVSEISKLPKNEQLLLRLIRRTIDHDGLGWLLALEQARVDGPREHIVNEIESRAARANPVKIQSAPFSGRMTSMPGRTMVTEAQPSLGM